MPHSLNIFFDKVFVISIDRNAQRLETFLSNNADLEIEIFKGVDGLTLFPAIEHVWNFPNAFFEEYQLLYDRCKHWNKGQLGCAMSNLLVQKEIVNRKLSKVLILEDDAQYVPKNAPNFIEAAAELPANWELLYLGYSAPTKWAEDPFWRVFVKIKHLIKPVISDGMSSRTIDNRYFASSYSKHLKRAGVYVGTHAYALSYGGAKKLVDLDTPLKHGFDTTLMYANYNKLVHGFALKKKLFVPHPGFETSLIN